MLPTEVKEIIFGWGHENIQATHHSTLEFTRDTHLSKNGDCIIALATDKAPCDLSAEFQQVLRKPGAKLTITIEASGVMEQVHAFGSPQLTLSHPAEAVVRRTDYVSDRTLAVHADKAAKDLSRELADKLKNPRQKVKITLTARG